jgi:hypothetical protein
MEASLMVYSGASGANEFVEVIPPAVAAASTTRTLRRAFAGNYTTHLGGSGMPGRDVRVARPIRVPRSQPRAVSIGSR